MYKLESMSATCTYAICMELILSAHYSATLQLSSFQLRPSQRDRKSKQECIYVVIVDMF